MNLVEPPAGVTADAWAGTGGTELAAGDLWLLTWDSQALGLAVVSGVADGFALVWPATLPTQPWFSPAMALEETPLGVPMAIWPTRETGVGTHLFHRKLGTAVPERAMARTLDFLEGAVSSAPFEFVERNIPAEEIESANDLLVDMWEEICLHTWPVPEPGDAPLSQAALTQAGGGITVITEVLQLDTADAVALIRGERIATAVELYQLGAALEIDPLALISLRDSDLVLASPALKDEIVSGATELQVDEQTFRSSVQREFALAARSDGDPTALARAAIARARGHVA